MKRLEPGQEFDIAIMGAGVIGLSIALELSEHGQRVVMVDRPRPTISASWAAAGILPPMDPDRARDPLDRLHGLSHQMYPDWVDRIREMSEVDVEFWRCGGLHVARTAGELAALRATADNWRDDGIQYEELTMPQATELEPDLVQDRPPRMIYLVPEEAQVRTPRLLRGLSQACRRNKVVHATITEDIDWTPRADHTWLIQSADGPFCAEKICLATGAWTAQVATRLGVRLELEPRRGQMILLSASEVHLQRIINEGPRYLVPRRDGQILVGATVEDVGFDESTQEASLEELRSFAVGLVPELAEVPIKASWAGLRPRSGDGYPFLGALPGLSNAYVAAGHFRSGILLAPVTGLVMRQVMLNTDQTIEISAFRADRE